MVNLGFDLGKIKPCICGQMPRFEFFEGDHTRSIPTIVRIYCSRYTCNIPQLAMGSTIESTINTCNIPQLAMGSTIESTINTWNEIIDKYSNVKEEPEDSVKLKVCPVCGYSFAFGDVCPACQAELR